NEFVPLEQLVGAHLGALFPGVEVLDWHAFRITRYSDLELTNVDEPEDLLATIEQQVFKRRFGEVIRVEVEDGMPAHLRALLLEELRDERDDLSAGGLSTADITEAGDLLGLGDLMTLASLDLPALKDPGFTPVTPEPARVTDRSLFDVIRERDLLVH